MITDIFQPTHLLFILVVALLVLGPKRLPEVARSLGRGVRDFRGAMAGIEEQTHDMMQSATVPLPAPTHAAVTETPLQAETTPQAAVTVTADSSAPSAEPSASQTAQA